MPQKLHELGLNEAINLVRSGEVRLVEVVKDYIDWIEKIDRKSVV